MKFQQVKNTWIKKVCISAVSASIVLLPLQAFAEDLQLTSGQTINVELTSPTVTYTLTSTTGIESVSINGNTMTLTLAAGDTVRVANSSGFKIQNDLSAGTNCTQSSTSYIDFTATAVVTSSIENVCLSGGGGSGSAPYSYSLKINDGASSTNSRAVTLNISAGNAAKMKISNLSDFSDAAWINYAETKSWTLTEGSGQKRVYIQFQSSSGVQTDSISAAINLTGTETPAPTPTPTPTSGGGGAVTPTPTPKPTPTPTPTPTPKPTPAPSGGAVKEGSLVKDPTGPAVYIIEGGKKRPYLNGNIFLGHGKRFEDVMVANTSAYPTGDTVQIFPDSYNFTCGQLVKASNAKVYIVSKCETGQKKELTWIQTEGTFRAGGWSFDNLNLISDAKLKDFMEAASFDRSDTHPEGTLVKYRDGLKVYLLRKVDGVVKKSWVPNEKEFNSRGFQWRDIIGLSSREVYPDGPTLGGTVLGVSYSDKFTQDLSRGSSGDEVKLLQDILKQLGYFPLNVTANGYFGPSTQKAVKSFQTAYGINPTGTVGPSTRQVLNSL